jgi:hypothetical protein
VQHVRPPVIHAETPIFRAKSLIFLIYLDLPQFRAICPGGRCINDLAPLTPPFPQSYPQKLWATSKTFWNHGLGARF